MNNNNKKIQCKFTSGVWGIYVYAALTLLCEDREDVLIDSRLK